jgi:hypothetical protein
MLRVVLLCCTLLAPGAAYAQSVDVTGLRRFCVAQPDTDEFAAGVAYVTRVISQSVSSGLNPGLFCVSEKVEITQVRDTVCKSLQARRPAAKGEKADLLVQSALAQAWPCSKQ